MKESVKKSKAKAWALFSRYIRLRDCIKDTGNTQEGFCYTCRRLLPIKELQAGHFLPGRGGAVLFQEYQVHAQCMPCNVWKRGDWPNYFDHMIQDYGRKRVDKIMESRHETKQWKVYELDEIAETYKEKIKSILVS